MWTVIGVLIGVATFVVACIIGRESLASFYHEHSHKIRNRRTKDLNKPLKSWTARVQKDVFQGVDILPLSLEGKSLTSLSFKVKSRDKYWRAGFKLLLIDSQWSPATLVNPHSILIHVGRNLDGTHIICGYQNQDSKASAPGQRLSEATLPETPLPWVKENHWILVGVQLKDYDLVINLDKGEFEHQVSSIKSELNKQAFLVAWADHEDEAETIPREYKVKFKKIRYATR